jgi:hypothetical protein
MESTEAKEKGRQDAQTHIVVCRRRIAIIQLLSNFMAG